MSIVGCASYTPGKRALRGPTETLCSEFKLYRVSDQIDGNAGHALAVVPLELARRRQRL